MTANTGPIVAGQIKRADTRDSYPVVDINDALGGLKSAANAAALPALLNLYPMDLAIDQANGVIYQYVAGTYIPLPASSLPNLTPSGSAGTVTSVSVVTANGVSGTVATATTTPAITLTLGAITPSSVAATGTVTGSNLSGTNTGNVTIGTANGLSLSGQALSLALASTSTTGSLSSTDWNTFNGKGSGTVTGTGTSPQYAKWSGTSSLTGQTGIPNTDVTGLGTMSTQNANAVAITGGVAEFTGALASQVATTGVGLGTSTGLPQFYLVASGAGADLKYYDFISDNSGVLKGRMFSDNFGSSSNWLAVTRAAAVTTSVALGGRLLVNGVTDDTATALQVSGAGRFTGNVVASGSVSTSVAISAVSIGVSGTSPAVALINSTAAANNRYWQQYVDGVGTLHFAAINDAISATLDALTLTRSGIAGTTVATTGNLGVGAAPTANLSVSQLGTGAASTRGILLTGTAIDGSNTGTGMLFTIGHNSVNNKQVWFLDSDYAGLSTGSAVRIYSNTTGPSIIDGIRGDGGAVKKIQLGQPAQPGSGVNLAIATFLAGTATAGTAPAQFTAGVLLTTAVSGAMETDAANLLYYTPGSAVRLPFFPMTTVGDIIIGGTVTSSIAAPTRLAQGGNGTFLGVSGGVLGYYTPAGGGNVSNSGTPTVGQLGIWVTATTIQGVTTLPTAAVPAFTGDMTNSAGSLATTVGRINGTSLAGLATGILKNTTTTGVPSIAAANTDYLPATTAAIQSAAGAASAPALSLTGTPFVGTGTTSTPQLYLNGGTAPTTWNSTASGGTYLGVNAITGFAGNFLDFRTNGGSTLFQADSSGELIVTAFQQFVSVNGVTVGNSGANGFAISSTAFGSGAADTFLTRVGAANWRYGQADTAAPVAQSISMQGVVAGTTNTSGANSTFNASQGTGTGTSGSFLFKTAAAGSTGSSQNALATQLTIGPSSVTIVGTLSASNLSGTNTGDQTFASLSPLTTKGDVLGFSTVNARVPVGTDTFVLTADSTQTLGIKWAAAAGGGGFAIPAISGNWYTAGSVTGELGTTASSRSVLTGTLYYQPFFVSKAATYTKIGVLCGGSVVGTAVMGIYNDSGAMAPTGSPITNSTSGSMTLTINSFSSFTFSSPIALAAGIYWIAISTSGTSSIVAYGGNNEIGIGMGINGTPTTTNVAGQMAGYSQTFIYSATLPAVGTLTPTLAFGVGTGYVFLQAQ